MSISPTHKFLVTGANGFVGQALCRKLDDSGIAVTAIARSLKHNSLNYNYQKLIIKDINPHCDLQDALEDIAVVVHLAARVHVMNDKSPDPLKAFLDANLHTTLNLAKQAAKAGVKRFVYLSSIKVNGEYTDEKAFDEQDDLNPQDAYAISKFKAEQALINLSATTKMEVVIIRPPLVYGPEVRG